jgi:hypothetical protein
VKRHLAMLSRIISDFQSGYIANPSAAAERKRLGYEKALIVLKTQLEELHATVAEAALQDHHDAQEN